VLKLHHDHLDARELFANHLDDICEGARHDRAASNREDASADLASTGAPSALQRAVELAQ
jgi:hypothetical protein